MKLFRILFGSVFIFAGVMHFIRRQGFQAIVPNYLPFKKLIVWVSGIIEMIFGIIILIKKPSNMTKRLLRWFLIAVFPANIYMARNNIPLNGKTLPKWALWGRLPLQFVMMRLVRKL